MADIANRSRCSLDGYEWPRTGKDGRYNVQNAVDTKHHLIVTHEVTNVGSDRSLQLSRMTGAELAAASGSETIRPVADRGVL